LLSNCLLLGDSSIIKHIIVLFAKEFALH